MRRRLAASMCLIGVALPVLGHHGERQPVESKLHGWAVGPFALTDQHGRAYTDEHLHGCWTFVLIGDTGSCAVECGAALAALVGLCQRIARADAMQTTRIVFVSLDPKRDTPTRLRVYLAAYDSRFIGATGAPATLLRLVDDLGAGAAGGAGAASPSPAFRGSLLLIGPDATIRAEYLPPFDVPRLTAAYLRARGGRS